MKLMVKALKCWLRLLVRNQDLLAIGDISHCNNIDVAIVVIGETLVKCSPATFSHIACRIKLFFENTVDCREGI